MVKTTLAGGPGSGSAGCNYSVPREGEHLCAYVMKIADCLAQFSGISSVSVPLETMTTREK